jgi:hypothetical protein
MPLLTKDQFMLASAGKPRDITNTDEAAPPLGVDVLAYLDHIPVSEWGGFKRWDNFVEKVYRYPDNDHILFMTQTKNVYMVVIVRLDVALIRGHMLLDLNKEYGLTSR